MRDSPEPNRRQVWQGLVAAAIVGPQAALAKGSKDTGNSQPANTIDNLQAPEVLPGKWEIRPEYERELSRVGFVWNREFLRDLFIHNVEEGQTFKDILNVVPKTSDLFIVTNNNLDKETRGAVLRGVTGIGFPESRIHLIPTDKVFDSGWTQDIGEALQPVDRSSGTHGMLVSAPFMRADAVTKFFDAKQVESGRAMAAGNAVQANFYFVGGNFQPTRLADGSIGYMIGHDDILGNHKKDEPMTDALATQTIKKIAKFLRGAKVIMMGRGDQGDESFHIDHGAMTLPNMHALVAEVTDVGRRANTRIAQQRFNEYASQLEALGYMVTRVPHSSEDIERGRYSLNGMPYLDPNDKKVHVLFPVYDGEFTPLQKDAPLSQTDLIASSKAYRMYKAIAETGCVPHPIRDTLNLHKILRGSIHCAMQNLAQYELSTKSNYA
ncbi:hypothetical protein HY968_03420 [Candidatus Kaiserbacteria bacterium]|nr:hypothetical protein [Candidatus Kaiserbacteria bacterium]